MKKCIADLTIGDGLVIRGSASVFFFKKWVRRDLPTLGKVAFREFVNAEGKTQLFGFRSNNTPIKHMHDNIYEYGSK